MLNVVHKTGSRGGTFANIAAIMPLAKGMAKPRDYVRAAARRVDAAVNDGGISDDDIPF